MGGVCSPSCWKFLLEQKSDSLFSLWSHVATACCFVRKRLIVHVTIIKFSKTLQHLDMGPTLLSSSVIWFKLRCEIWISLIEIRNSSILYYTEKSFLFSGIFLWKGQFLVYRVFFLLSAVITREQICYWMAENSSEQSPLCKEFDSSLIAGGIQSYKFCSDNAT